jgi:hypothetical protein
MQPIVCTKRGELDNQVVFRVEAICKKQTSAFVFVPVIHAQCNHFMVLQIQCILTVHTSLLSYWTNQRFSAEKNTYIIKT